MAVVLDTLNRSLTGSENSDEDMGTYIKATDAIREAFDCSVLVVHHCGNDSRHEGPHQPHRSCRRPPGRHPRRRKNILVDVEFMKDGEAGETIVSVLESLEVGFDDERRYHELCSSRS